MRRVLILLTLVVLVFGFGIAACSDSGDDNAQDVSGVEDDDDNGSETDDPEPSADPDEFCARVRQAHEATDAAETDATSSDDPLGDAVAQIDDLREVAPNAEIDDALAVYADMFTKVDALDLPDDPANPTQVDLGAFIDGPYLELVQIMLDPALVGASTTLTTYFVDECGVDLAPEDLGGAGMPGFDFDQLANLDLQDLGLEDLGLENLNLEDFADAFGQGG